MSMPRVTIGFGLVLILVGFLGATLALRDNAQPGTALIPAYFGGALTVCGMLALHDKLRPHAMHAAAAVALIGFLVPAFMVVKVLFTGITRPLAFAMQGIMAVVCGGFVLLAVRSFFQARRAREISKA